MTSLYLLNVPFESNYKDTVYFIDEAHQLGYMRDHRVTTPDDSKVYSFQRKDGVIRYPEHIDNLYKCNYVQYKNNNGKWMYAFITDMEYVNEERTDIYIETDVMQTWMFDYTVKPSFVEREHTDADFVVNTVPETLETGPYVCGSNPGTVEALKDHSIVWGATKTEGGAIVTGTRYNGIYSGIKYYFTPDYDIAGFQDTIIAYDKAGAGDAIQCMFIAPTAILQGEDDGEGNIQISGPLDFTTEPVEINVKWVDLFEGDDYSTKLPDYMPRNKKLNTFPYCYLLVSNNNGSDVIYRYEYLTDPNVDMLPSFTIKGVVTPGCSIRLTPDYYNNIHDNEIEGINLGKFPICNWTSDVYTNWLTQNSVNIGVDLAGGIINMAGGAVSAIASNGVMGGGAFVEGALGVGRVIGNVYQHTLIPPQNKGNINCGDVITASGNNNFFFYRMGITSEYASIIDDYFDMFGYKTCRVKVPNKDHRPYYWYTKTLDVNIDGAIPNKDLERIKKCYDQGITFWRANSTMGVYHSEDQDNSIE